jgi:hypothetical protein
LGIVEQERSQVEDTFEDQLVAQRINLANDSEQTHARKARLPGRR